LAKYKTFPKIEKFYVYPEKSFLQQDFRSVFNQNISDFSRFSQKKILTRDFLYFEKEKVFLFFKRKICDEKIFYPQKMEKESGVSQENMSRRIKSMRNFFFESW